MIQLQHVCTVVASTLTGFILLYGREKISPAVMFNIATVFSFISAYFIYDLQGRQGKTNETPKEIFIFNGLALGVNFVTMSSFCFEEYGKDGFGYTFGVMMTFAAFGFLICDEVIF